MEAATLDEFMALNDQLAALVEAGVPLDLGLDEASDVAAETVQRFNAAVARRVSRGATLDEALDDNADRVPNAYRCLMQIGLRSGRLDAALDGSHRVAEAAENSRQGIRTALIYPLVVCALVYLGIIGFCLWFVPTLEAMHAEMRLEPGRGLRTLQALRDTMPWWAPIPPAALIVWLAWKATRRAHGRSALADSDSPWSRFTGMSRAVAQQRWANYADALAALASAGAPLAEAMRLAACASGEPRIANASRGLAAAIDAGATLDDEHPAVRQVPPLLRWALLHSEPAVDRSRALRMAADTYRQQARRSEDRVRTLAPLLASVLIGGVAVLLYGLALFAPVIELMQGIAVPPTHP